MSKEAGVLLITGPAGSGKSTLAQCVSQKLGCELICEDDYWVNHGWGSGTRTTEQEKMIQTQVFDDLLVKVQSGKLVVLEFILYKNPPNPLTAYQKLLNSNSIIYKTIALKPTVDEIMKRLQKRGRPSDLDDLDGRRKDAENHVHCLESEYIDPSWIIDPTNLSVDELYNKFLNVVKD